jgi:protein translocase SecG subunit
MQTFLQVVVIVSAVLLTIVILLQNQGSGLGMAFGGESGFYRTKRGAERVLFFATIALAVIFVGSVIGLLVV